jgi:hypothetical protein
MKSKLYSLVILITVIVLGSCKSASKLYEKGNYDEAVTVAAKKLQKDPNDLKLQGIIRDAYRYAVNDHESSIRSISETSSDAKWEQLYNEYASLQNLYNAIYKSPSVYELVRPADYSSYLNTYAEKAADVHYQRGIDLMDHAGNKKDFRNAYREFQAASRFKPNDEEIAKMLHDAYEMAVTRVVVMPVDDYDHRYGSYGSNGSYGSYPSYNNYGNSSFDENSLVQKLQYNASNEFVKFYSSWDANRTNIIPDEIMELHFSRMNIGGLRDQSTSREVYKDVLVKETVYKPDSVVREYAKVKARITTTKRSMLSEGVLSINIRDNNGRWLWNDNVRSDYNWNVEFSSYTGDERALSESDKQLLNHQQQNAPDQYEVIRCIKENIYNDFLSRVRNYYGRF